MLINDLSDYRSCISSDLDRIQNCLVAVNTDAPRNGLTPPLHDCVLALATHSFLVLSNNWSYTREGECSHRDDRIKIALEFHEEQGCSRPSALKWISDEIIAVGFESGIVVCFNCEGEELFEYHGQGSPVQAIKAEPRDGDASSDILEAAQEPVMWILYESGFIISVRLTDSSFSQALT